ncbi:unnamed protein product [Diatraea saccharalis]|uniref:Endonuclease-reverse transcriptase n=1 Tax=Diatraea saccharalis TaxID=40085 RepID=A0A9N9RAH1_9NEOP|nr:unnamed protein product [Diatraea saccharalis]
MNIDTALLLEKLNEKLNQQTLVITTAVTNNVLEVLNEKLSGLMEENNVLKNKVTYLEQKLNIAEKEKRKNNLIFFGIQELGKTEIELVDYIKDLIEDAGVHLNSQEISNVQRIGRWTGKKNRPVVVSFSCLWKKHLVMKNKTNLPQDIYIKEDFPKEVLEKRRQLKIQADEERKKGNIAFIKYDKLVVKTHSETSRDKRKREESSSPNESQQKKTTTQTKSAPQPTKTSTNTIAKPGILNYVERTRSASLSGLSKN